MNGLFKKLDDDQKELEEELNKQYLKQKEEKNSQNWEMVNVKTKSFPGIQMRKDDASTEGTNARKLDLQLVWS